MCHSCRMCLSVVLLTYPFLDINKSHVKMLWANGARVIDQRNKFYMSAVRQAIVEVLHCTDPAFTEEIIPFFSTLFLKTYQRPLSNCKLKYRCYFTQYCKFVGFFLHYSNIRQLLTIPFPVHQKMKEMAWEAKKHNKSLEVWKCPTVEDVLKATRVSPSTATKKEKDAMFLFLIIALSSVDARLNKQWKQGMTHMHFFPKTYQFEVAVAFLMIDHFSNTNNILYNSGLIDEDGNIMDEVRTPKQKKRKKMQTSKNSLEIQAAYYNFIKLIKAEMKIAGFEERMAAWDEAICDNHRCMW